VAACFLQPIVNAFLKYPRQAGEVPQPYFGSGRYYLRLSQVESVPAPEPGGSRSIWLMEGFDAQWFEQNSEVLKGDGWLDYYELAELFVLEIHVPRGPGWSFLPFGILHAAEAEDSEPDEWFLLEAERLNGGAPREDQIRLLIYSNLYQQGIPATMNAFQLVEERKARLLRAAVSTAHIPRASAADVDAALAAVGNVDWAVVYDVGQGNAVGLCDWTGAVVAYFDFGGGVLANRLSFPSALKGFCFSQRAPIVLSHWDFDHWSSANRDTNSLKSTWIAPDQSVGTTHVALMASIVKAGKLLLVPSGFPPIWRQQIYLELCTGKSKGRNHSGLALTLSEKPCGAGGRMLFPGDARYNVVPSFTAAGGYCSVVAPHHGADMRSSMTPTCPSQAHSRLVYSFGAGNTFGHPRTVTRQHHDTNGWRDPTITLGSPTYEVRETANRAAGSLGHILLGWKTHVTRPPLPCSGAVCQLQAQQV
jgi:hypothetical protein